MVRDRAHTKHPTKPAGIPESQESIWRGQLEGILAPVRDTHLQGHIQRRPTAACPRASETPALSLAYDGPREVEQSVHSPPGTVPSEYD